MACQDPGSEVPIMYNLSSAHYLSRPGCIVAPTAARTRDPQRNPSQTLQLKVLRDPHSCVAVWLEDPPQS